MFYWDSLNLLNLISAVRFSKNGSLLLISEQDIPRSDSSLLAAFLTVRKPSVVFFAPETKGAQAKYATTVYEAISHALQDTDSLLVSWHDTKMPFPLNENCHCLTFELPQLLISPDNRNFVTDWIENFLNRKRVVVKEDDYVDLIDSRLLSLMSVKAALKALSNPDLCGSCRISANGTPLRSEVIEYILRFALKNSSRPPSRQGSVAAVTNTASGRGTRKFSVSRDF